MGSHGGNPGELEFRGTGSLPTRYPRAGHQPSPSAPEWLPLGKTREGHGLSHGAFWWCASGRRGHFSRPHCLIGSIVICEELERRQENYGISYIAVLDFGENNMVETFAPVVPRLAGK